jgi:Cys-rich protein (TIGR01571 family)
MPGHWETGLFNPFNCCCPPTLDCISVLLCSPCTASQILFTTIKQDKEKLGRVLCTGVAATVSVLIVLEAIGQYAKNVCFHRGEAERCPRIAWLLDHDPENLILCLKWGGFGVFVTLLMVFYSRMKARSEKGISGSCYNDFLATVCCSWCAQCQLMREMELGKEYEDYNPRGLLKGSVLV